MPIRHISTICCDYLIRADNRRLTFAGTFRNVSAPTLPIVKTPMGVAVEFMGDAGDLFSISIEGNGIELVLAEDEFPVPPPVQSEYQQQGIVVAAQVGLSFQQPGICEVILRSGEEVIHRTAIGVFLLPEEQNDAEQHPTE